MTLTTGTWFLSKWNSLVKERKYPKTPSTEHLVRNTAWYGCPGVLKLCCSLQVLWSGALGDRHAGGAAVPGHDQRAGAALRHGRRAAGEARQLSRHAVSATTALRAQIVPPEPCGICSCSYHGRGWERVTVVRGAAQSLPVLCFMVVRHSRKQLCCGQNLTLGYLL